MPGHKDRLMVPKYTISPKPRQPRPGAPLGGRRLKKWVKPISGLALARERFNFMGQCTRARTWPKGSPPSAAVEASPADQ